MRSTIRMLLLSILATIAVSLFFPGCDRTSVALSPDPLPAVTREITTVVFIFNSEACDCEKNRNEDAEAIIKAVLSDMPEPKPIQRIDTASQTDELREYSAKTKITFLPVLLGLDERGEVVKKLEGFFEENEVTDILL